MRSVLLAGSVLFAAATTPVAAQNAGAEAEIIAADRAFAALAAEAGTAEAFAHVTPQARVTDWQGLTNTPLTEWHLHLRNDFEAGMRAQHRAVDELLTLMANAGADHVQMTGTGSTVFGLFTDQASASHAETMCKETRLGLVWKGQC